MSECQIVVPDGSQAKAVRGALAKAFKGVKAGTFVVLPALLGVLGLPKGCEQKQHIMWTSQTEARWAEMRKDPPALSNPARFQILAGPSGIGKSNLSLLLALRCFAEGQCVLYIPDAGELWEQQGRTDLLPSLVTAFCCSNAGLLSETDVGRITDWSSFKQFLNANEVIVFVLYVCSTFCCCVRSEGQAAGQYPHRTWFCLLRLW